MEQAPGKMNKEGFENLRLQQKLMHLWNHGELIAERIYPGSEVSLFLLDGFFAEVFFDPEHNRLEDVRILDNRHILYCYVKDLNLGSLMRIG